MINESDVAIQLARRAVRCKNWSWEPGMLPILPGMGPMPRRDIYRPMTPGCVPDLTDPATIGAFMALIRRLYGCPHLWLSYCSDDYNGSLGGAGWFIAFDYADKDSPWLRLSSQPGLFFPTEGEALVHALEVSP